MATGGFPETVGHLRYSQSDLKESAVFALGTFQEIFFARRLQAALRTELPLGVQDRAKIFNEQNPQFHETLHYKISDIADWNNTERQGSERLTFAYKRRARHFTHDMIPDCIRGEWSAFEPPYDSQFKEMFDRDPSVITILNYIEDADRERANTATIRSTPIITEVTLDYFAAGLVKMEKNPYEEHLRQAFAESDKRYEVEELIESMNRLREVARIEVQRSSVLDQHGLTIMPGGSIVPYEVMFHAITKAFVGRYKKAVWTYLLEFGTPPVSK